MKNKILLIILSVVMFACETPESKAIKQAEKDAEIAHSAVLLSGVYTQQEMKKELLKVYDAESVNRYFKELDTLSTNIDKNLADMNWDTIGVDTAPIKIISAKAVDNSNQYITDKNIKISFKNVGTKKIVGIRIKWYVTNAFGEPVKDMGGNYDGFGRGLDDTPLGAGKSTSGTWDSGSGLCKNVKAWPIEVAFEDGTKWKSKYKGEK